MTALEYILDGLEAALSLERELGTRVVELEAGALAPAPVPATTAPATAAPPAAAIEKKQIEIENGGALAAPPPAAPAPSPVPGVGAPGIAARSAPAPATLPFAFLHDRPLSPEGEEMIAKIVAALGFAPNSIPVVYSGAKPDTAIFVVLGARALEKWFPGVSSSPGKWISPAAGVRALVTYSPNYFLRFRTVTDTVKKIKFDMWKSLQTLKQYIP